MSRAIDHLVLCVNDLDAACDAYRKLGFTVTRVPIIRLALAMP